MTELTPEQNEAAIILKHLWDQAKQQRGFTQKDAELETGISQPNISAYLTKKKPLGPSVVPKFAKFLGVTCGEIMESLSYLDELTPPSSTGDYAPVIREHDIDRWISGELNGSNLPDSKTVPVYPSLTKNRPFAIRVSNSLALPMKNSIRPGDLLICDPTRRPDADELGIYRVDGDLVLGRLIRHAGRWLLTFDSQLEPIELVDEDQQRVCTIAESRRIYSPLISFDVG